MTSQLAGKAVARAANAAFGKPLVTNVLRGLLVEAMIAEALPEAWTWCAADYAGWDFEHADGTRMEVKQSAARQTWSNPGSVSKAASFDIRPRTGRYEGEQWVSEPGRAASLYVFAYHPLTGDEADHREPDQWLFYVAPATLLPAQSRTSLGAVRRLAVPVNISGLAQALENIS